MLKLREYFLAYGLVQSSNSRSVFAFIRSSTSLFFTQILFVVTNDIQKKLGKKKRSRSLSPKWLRELPERQRNCSRKLNVTWFLKCSLYSLYGYLWTPFRRDFPSYRRCSTKSSQHNKNCLLASTISELEQPRGRRRKRGNQKQQV